MFVLFFEKFLRLKNYIFNPSCKLQYTLFPSVHHYATRATKYVKLLNTSINFNPLQVRLIWLHHRTLHPSSPYVPISHVYIKLHSMSHRLYKYSLFYLNITYKNSIQNIRKYSTPCIYIYQNSFHLLYFLLFQNSFEHLFTDSQTKKVNSQDKLLYYLL